MENIIRKAFTIVLICMITAGTANAQAKPAGSAPQPSEQDTMQQSLQKSIENLERLMRELSDPNSASPLAVKRGDKKDGGIVYWTEPGGKHGLIVWRDDLGIKKWEESVEACKKLGPGWHLATKEEMDKLYAANLELKILSSMFLFHSSTEPEPGYIWRISLSSGEWKKGYKTGTGSTAAVKSF